MAALNVQTHWDKLLLPSNAAFHRAEDALTHASRSEDPEAIKDACYDALREGMVAALFVYHFHEVVLDRKALVAPPATIGDMRNLISGAARDANGNLRPDDHNILGEVANAVKHAELKSNGILHVERKGRVLAITDTGPDACGEGKPAGTPQVVVLTHAGERSLKAVIDNVMIGWSRLLNL